MPASDLISRAARFFVLAEQASHLRFDYTLWDLSAPLVVETASHLPAMTAAVRRKPRPDILVLQTIAPYPLPGVLPPEAVPWHNHLVAAWEVHRASSSALLQNIVRQALVRLDGCGMPDGQERPSRLPEWLAEAQKIASGEWRVENGKWQVTNSEWRGAGARSNHYLDWDRYQEIKALAALAAWRPAPRVLTPPETLQDWVDFWMEMRRSADPVEKGIAAIALLNLPEADLRGASIPPVPAGELLQQLATSIQAVAEKTDINCLFLLNLLDWQPVKGITWPGAEVRDVAQSWLKVTRGDHRCAAWRQLVRWDRAGSLDICGMDLLSELLQAVPDESSEDVLWEMAKWLPGAKNSAATERPDSSDRLPKLEAAWERHRTSGRSLGKAAGWLAGIRLHQAGLALEPSGNFIGAYLCQVANTWESGLAFILAQWSPGADAPERWCRDWHAGWQQRFSGGDRVIRQIAVWALLRPFLEKEHGRSLRGMTLELWRAGTKASSKMRDILGAVFARLQEVQVSLAAGEVVDFEEKPVPPAEHCRPPLALPPGRIADNEWKMENEEWKMENEEWKMKRQEATPNLRLVPDCLSR